MKFYAFWLDHGGTYEEYRKKIVKIYEKEIKGRRQEDIIGASRKAAQFDKDRIYIYVKNIIERLLRKKRRIVVEKKDLVYDIGNFRLVNIEKNES
ncbi:MAG: hypothetical protein WC831_01930 [Parcubacteria group bacterium]